jgi:hypothetical protein
MKILSSKFSLPKSLAWIPFIIEVVSKAQIRFKGKASGRAGKRSIHWVCEHLLEACNAAIGP